MSLQSLIARLRTLGAALTPMQLAMLAGSFIAVVGVVVGSAYWINAPTYAVLFADMDPESAGGVVTQLKGDKVPFVLDDGGRTIRVAAERVDELRLEYASQGMPASGRIGFEIFDRTAFGVTDFLEHVNYRRALEGELARTIGTIGAVASVRVHIAMPRPSLFAGQDEAAKASVVLKLRNNRPLPASTVSAISGLVAASVEGLRPEGVVVIDTFGRPLTRSSDDDGEAAGGLHVERQQQIEHELSARVVSLIEPIVGAEHVRVNVSAKLNADSQEETEERFDPTTVVRSHQSVIQGGAAAVPTQGIAGVRGNLPPPLPDPAAKPAAAVAQMASALTIAQPTHTSETTNYEVSKLTRHRIQPQGQIARLSVAVLLDDPRTGPKGQTVKSRSPEELQKIHDVVAAAVGLDVDRGDRLTVTDIPFEEVSTADEPAVPWYQRFAPALLNAGRIIGVLAVVLIVVFGALRPTMRQALVAAKFPRAGAVPQLSRTVEDLEGEMDAELESGDERSQKSARLPVLTRRVVKLAQQEPENAARMLRAWLVEEER